jgi:Xaa-Pro dipeptidase
LNKIYFDKTVEVINKNELDAMLIIPSEELEFLMDFSPSLCERFQGLFIKKSGEYFYFCNALTRDELEGYVPEDSVYYWYDNSGFLDYLEEVLAKEDLVCGRIGVNSTARAFNILEISDNIDVTFTNGKSVLEDIRIIKSPEEIEKLKIAASRTDKVMEEIWKYIKPGISEGQIVTKLDELFSNQDMAMEFAIVASGPNAAMPHYSGTDRVIEEMDRVLLDIGGKYQGLCSDMTRTVFVGGITDRDRRLYEIVRDSYKKGLDYAVKGRMAREIDKAAREVIEDNEYGQYFPTRLGHGIGYSVHEAPYITGFSDLKIDNGMVFSIEPGIYIKDDIGIRIEDIVIVEDGIGHPINKASKDIIIV